MTYQQSLELAEIEADLAFERYIDAFNADEHPEAVDRLSIDAQLAQAKYDELTNLVPAQ